MIRECKRIFTVFPGYKLSFYQHLVPNGTKLPFATYYLLSARCFTPGIYPNANNLYIMILLVLTLRRV